MLNIFEVTETNKMIEKENLDVRTITMGISLLDCMDCDLNATGTYMRKLRDLQAGLCLWEKRLKRNSEYRL